MEPHVGSFTLTVRLTSGDAVTVRLMVRAVFPRPEVRLVKPRVSPNAPAGIGVQGGQIFFGEVKAPQPAERPPPGFGRKLFQLPP